MREVSSGISKRGLTGSQRGGPKCGSTETKPLNPIFDMAHSVQSLKTFYNVKFSASDVRGRGFPANIDASQGKNSLYADEHDGKNS